MAGREFLDQAELGSPIATPHGSGSLPKQSGGSKLSARAIFLRFLTVDTMSPVFSQSFLHHEGLVR